MFWNNENKYCFSIYESKLAGLSTLLQFYYILKPVIDSFAKFREGSTIGGVRMIFEKHTFARMPIFLYDQSQFGCDIFELLSLATTKFCFLI